MKKTRVLVLGNDPQINQIAFDKLALDVITIGVNRIWLKHIPNYFFFNDYDIVEDLDAAPEIRANLIQKSSIFASDWLRPSAKKRNANIPSWVKVFERANKLQFPDSVSTGLQIFSREYIPQANCIFYIAGVSLTWQEPSHFWKTADHRTRNNHGGDWYTPRFDKMINNFRRLKGLGYTMVSVNPNSALNKFIRYENIGNLYRK